jgi:hypothetical protein
MKRLETNMSVEEGKKNSNTIVPPSFSFSFSAVAWARCASKAVISRWAITVWIVLICVRIALICFSFSVIQVVIVVHSTVPVLLVCLFNCSS